MATQRDWTWLAGFLDADGCFGIYGGYPRVSISQTNRPILEKIVRIVGSGSISSAQPTSAGTAAYRLCFGSYESRLIAEKVLPDLGRSDKQEKARRLIEWEPTPYTERRNHRSQQPEFKKAVALYKKGLSCSEVAERLGLKGPTVNYWIKREGLTRTYEEAQRLRRKKGK